MSAHGQFSTDQRCLRDVRFSNRPFRVKHFQTIRRCSVDVAHGLALLFGNWRQGPSIMGFEDEVEQSVAAALPTKRQVQADMRTHLIHRPARDIIHRSVELEFPPIGFDHSLFLGGCGFPGPAELGAVNPDAVHVHGQPSSQRDDRLFDPAVPGDLHRPGLEPGPFLRTQHALSCFVEIRETHHRASGLRRAEPSRCAWQSVAKTTLKSPPSTEICVLPDCYTLKESLFEAKKRLLAP